MRATREVRGPAPPPREARAAGARGGVVARLVTLVRRVTGMPDYAAYVAHCRAAHPDRPVPSEQEFFDEYLVRRYEGGPTRCC